MKTFITLTILILMNLGCSKKQKPKYIKLPLSETLMKKDTIFRQVADFPIIKDTTNFILDLRRVFGLEVDESPTQKQYEKITTYKKVKIFGSDKDYLFIEYEYGGGCMATYPWKLQLILTNDGRLVKSMSGQRFDFVKIFPNENPFILSVVATAKGNGGHELYKISGDTLENVYEGYYDYNIRTYDAHQDNKIYEPNELNLRIKDFNRDGFNDLAFVGKVLLIRGQTKYGDWFDEEKINGKTISYSVDNPFKKYAIEFIFLYDKKTGHFKAKENYIEKYKLDE